MGRQPRKAATVQTLAAIAQFTAERGYAPTYRDLGSQLGLAHSAVFYRVRDLASNGLVHEAPGIARSLRVTHAGLDAIRASGNGQQPHASGRKAAGSAQ